MRLVFTTFLVLLLNTCLSKEVPKILKKLVQASGSVNTFTHFSEAFFPLSDLPMNFLNEPQHILKMGGRIYLLPSGTGRIYEIIITKDSISLKRKDSTYFTGYNFQSIPFTLNGNIYSYGGYGFWKFNGDLRVFLPSISEWDIIPTNIYLPNHFKVGKSENVNYLDTLDQTLYTSISKIDDNINKSQQIQLNHLAGKIYKINIKNGFWEELGKIKNGWYMHLGLTKWGLLIKNQKGFQIFDLKRNKIINIIGKTFEKLIHTPTSTNYQDIRLSYCIGNTLYVGDMDNWIDSIYIDPKDIVDAGLPIYKPKSHYQILIIVGIILLTGLGIVIFFRISKKRDVNIETSNDENESAAAHLPLVSSMSNELLDEREKELLHFILNQSKQGKLTSILQINDLLGLNKRTLEVQKRIRTDMIGSINAKCKFLTNNNEPILSRTRSEVDKRMFEYFVPPNRFAEAETILQKNKIPES